MRSKRLKNYGLWVSIFALMGMLLNDFSNIHITMSQYELYTETILTILVFLGIINDPTSGKWYKD